MYHYYHYCKTFQFTKQEYTHHTTSYHEPPAIKTYFCAIGNKSVGPKWNREPLRETAFAFSKTKLLQPTNLVNGRSVQRKTTQLATTHNNRSLRYQYSKYGDQKLVPVTMTEIGGHLERLHLLSLTACKPNCCCQPCQWTPSTKENNATYYDLLRPATTHYNWSLRYQSF